VVDTNRTNACLPPKRSDRAYGFIGRHAKRKIASLSRFFGRANTRAARRPRGRRGASFSHSFALLELLPFSVMFQRVIAGLLCTGGTARSELDGS